MRADKGKALVLRRKGKSYSFISRKLDIPKGTLSNWFIGEKWSQNIAKNLSKKNNRNQTQRLIKYSRLRAEEALARNEEVLRKASREINKLTLKDLKLVGSTLYWAEGAKTQKGRLLFVNSDFGMVKIMMRFFREILKIQEGKLQISVQIHPNISEKKAKEFWSKATGIQTNRFQKTLFQISKASKRKRNKNSLPFGTCRINVNSTINFHRVAGWIQGIAKIR